jgi:hypothetical protein
MSLLVEVLLNTYKVMGCKMTLKTNSLDSHLDFFPANLATACDELENAFINKYPQWRSDVTSNVSPAGWLTTAGNWLGKPQRQNTRVNHQ